MNRRAFLGLGAAFVGVGALQRSGAFSSAVAGRGIGISTAADSDALLGIEGNDDPSVTPTITNNSGTYSMDVTLESDGVEFDQDSFELGPGDHREVEIFGDDDTATITAELNANGTDAGSIVLERFFEVPEIAAILQVEGSVSEAYGNGRYDFNLTNEGDDPVTLDGFGIEWTDPEATRVPRPQGNDSILEAQGTQIIDETIFIGDGIVDVIDGEEVSMEVGEEVNFLLERFSDENGNGIQVVDVDLKVRAAGDGSTAVIELRPDEEDIE